MREIAYKFVVCRYVHDVVRDEPINIGVVLHCPAERRSHCMFLRPAKKIRRLPRGVDLSVLDMILADFDETFTERSLLTTLSADDLAESELLERFTAPYCNQIQFTRPRGRLGVEDLVQEARRLFAQYVSPLPLRQKEFAWDTPTLRREVYRSFVTAGLRDKIKRDVLIRDPDSGVPIDFDFQWRNGKPNFVQAVSLRDMYDAEKVNKAKILRTNCDLLRRIPDYHNSHIDTVVYPPEKPTEGYEMAVHLLRQETRIVTFEHIQQVIEHIADTGRPLT